MDKTRVFVSSTCYDLSQVRRDLESFIESCGHQPVLSDSPGIAIPPGLSTLEACRWLVHSSDVFVLMIGGRFGSADEATGKSVTNLEYETALAAGIPVYAFFDHEIWAKRDTYSRLKEMVEDGTLDEDKISDALGEKVQDSRVFEFLREVTTAERDSWIYEFSSARDIVEHLKRSWSLLLKDLLDIRRQRARSAALAQVQPELGIMWQGSSGEPPDALVLPLPPQPDTEAILLMLGQLRPTNDEIRFVREHKDEIGRRLPDPRSAWPTRGGPTVPSIENFERFIQYLDSFRRSLESEPAKFRWRFNLLSRAITPDLIVANSGSCPAEELVVYIQPTDRVLFGEPSQIAELDLSLPSERPAHVETVLGIARRLGDPEPPPNPGDLAQLFSGLSTSPSPWSPMRLSEPVVYSGPNREVVQFSVEEGSLRVDIPGRLKHRFSRRVTAEGPMITSLLQAGQEADLEYQIHADNLPVPARGTLRVRAQN